jgi:hypothetical protein
VPVYVLRFGSNLLWACLHSLWYSYVHAALCLSLVQVSRFGQSRALQTSTLYRHQDIPPLCLLAILSLLLWVRLLLSHATPRCSFQSRHPAFSVHHFNHLFTIPCEYLFLSRTLRPRRGSTTVIPAQRQVYCIPSLQLQRAAKRCCSGNSTRLCNTNLAYHRAVPSFRYKLIAFLTIYHDDLAHCSRFQICL